MFERFMVWVSTSRVFTWLIVHVFSPLDPLIFKATNGRLTAMGPPAVPMLTLTTTGRHSGQPRSVQLACIEHEGDQLVVASSMGREKHPGWRYNLEAHPRVQVRVRGEQYAAEARVLTDAEKANVWPGIRETIPQMKIYEKRTDRNIGVIRLSRAQA